MTDLTYDEIYALKDDLKELPTELFDFTEEVKQKRKCNLSKQVKTNWRFNNKHKSNWLINKKNTQDSDNKTLGEIREILNKIDKKNYDTMTENIMKLDIKTAKQLQDLVNVFLHKVMSNIDKGVFVKLFHDLIPVYIEDEGTKIFFRNLFLDRCQKLFSECLNFDNPENRVVKNKSIATNLIIFIGELYKNDLLTDNIVHSCLFELFTTVNKGKFELIEILCSFITTIHEKYKKTKSLDGLIKKLKIIQNKKTLGKRFKFAIMDTIETIE